VNAADVRALTDMLLARTDAVTAQAELTGDSCVDGFDCAVLKRLQNRWNTPPPEDRRVGCWATKAGQWRIRDGMGEQTVTMKFTGKPGHYLRLAYGYWDPLAVDEETGKNGVWKHNDDTQLGKHQFDENGELQLQLDIPPKAKSVEIMIYNYTDESTGTVVQLDKSLVGLAEVVRQEG